MVESNPNKIGDFDSVNKIQTFEERTLNKVYQSEKYIIPD